MNVLQSIFLGLVQGITEFLPVSSSGHLAICEKIFHIDTGGSMLFDVLLHLATLFVVIFYFRKEVWKMIVTFFSILGDLFYNLKARFFTRGGEEIVLRRIITSNYRKFVLLVLVSTIPTGIIGVLAEKLINDASASLLAVGIFLIVTACLLFLSDRVTDNTKIPKDVTWREGIIIGIAQGFAVLPGLSRSGTTISTSLFLGLDRTFAVKYSFILSIPAILGATLLEIGKAGSEAVSGGLIGVYAAGMIAAAIAGYFSIRLLTKLVVQKKLKGFAIYCCAVGALAIIGNFVF